MLGALFTGIGSLISGINQSNQGEELRDEANKLYKSAKSEIPEEYSTDLLSAREEVQRRRRSYETGANATGIEDTLSNLVSTGGQNITALAGGNTGAAISAMMNLSSSAGSAYNKALADYNQMSDNLLSLESNLTNKLVERRDDIRKKRADFDLMRAHQLDFEGASKEKTGEENIIGSLNPLGDSLTSLISSSIMPGL